MRYKYLIYETKEELKNLKELLRNDFKIVRSDNDSLYFADIMIFGTIFQKLDEFIETDFEEEQ